MSFSNEYEFTDSQKSSLVGQEFDHSCSLTYSEYVCMAPLDMLCCDQEINNFV